MTLPVKTKIYLKRFYVNLVLTSIATYHLKGPVYEM